MEIQLNHYANEIAFYITILSWIAFGFGFLILKRRSPQKENKRDKKAMIGLLLEGAGFALVFSVRRDTLTDIVPMSKPLEMMLIILLGCLAVLSVWSSLAAVKTLGKQWDFKAKIIEGHELITSGPYNIVRHPIYSGMFGLLIVTGFSISQLWAFLTAIVLYLAGTIFRTKVEEKLLIQYFGDEYIEYKKRIRGIIPFLF